MPISNSDLITQLKWRYATKAFDTSKKISDADWSILEEALVLSPSSYGLQPWKFFVVDTPELRSQLVEHSWGQKQVVDASHFVVFAVKSELVAADVEKYIARISEVRGVPEDVLADYKNMMLGTVSSQSPEALREWGSKQVYIALGNFLASAALLGIDACPMEGFLAAKYDEVLGLTEKGFSARVICAVGYRSSEDTYADAAKVRFPVEEVIEHL